MLRPPNVSDQMPKFSRNRAPDRIDDGQQPLEPRFDRGLDLRRLIVAAASPSISCGSALIFKPSTPSISQTANSTVKASVESHRTRLRQRIVDPESMPLSNLDHRKSLS